MDNWRVDGILITLAALTLLPAASGKDLQPLDLCTVVLNWRTYSGNPIRVKATFQVGAEQSVLSDPACQADQQLVAISLAGHLKGKKGRLRRILAKNREANVILEGVFHGPEQASIDPKLPDPIREGLRGSTVRYGHLGSFQMMIEVTKIIQAEQTTDNLSPH